MLVKTLFKHLTSIYKLLIVIVFASTFYSTNLSVTSSFQSDNTNYIILLFSTEFYLFTLARTLNSEQNSNKAPSYKGITGALFRSQRTCLIIFDCNCLYKFTRWQASVFVIGNKIFLLFIRNNNFTAS